MPEIHLQLKDTIEVQIQEWLKYRNVQSTGFDIQITNTTTQDTKGKTELLVAC